MDKKHLLKTILAGAFIFVTASSLSIPFIDAPILSDKAFALTWGANQSGSLEGTIIIGAGESTIECGEWWADTVVINGSLNVNHWKWNNGSPSGGSITIHANSIVIGSSGIINADAAGYTGGKDATGESNGGNGGAGGIGGAAEDSHGFSGGGAWGFGGSSGLNGLYGFGLEGGYCCGVMGYGGAPGAGGNGTNAFGLEGWFFGSGGHCNALPGWGGYGGSDGTDGTDGKYYENIYDLNGTGGSGNEDVTPDKYVWMGSGGGSGGQGGGGGGGGGGSGGYHYWAAGWLQDPPKMDGGAGGTGGCGRCGGNGGNGGGMVVLHAINSLTLNGTILTRGEFGTPGLGCTPGSNGAIGQGDYMAGWGGAGAITITNSSRNGSNGNPEGNDNTFPPGDSGGFSGGGGGGGGAGGAGGAGGGGAGGGVLLYCIKDNGFIVGATGQINAQGAKKTSYSSENGGTVKIFYAGNKPDFQQEQNQQLLCGRPFFSLHSTYSISGKVTDPTTGNGLSGVKVSTGSGSATTGTDGKYTIPELEAGSYTVTPSRSGYCFSPTSMEVSVGPDATSKDFVGTLLPTIAVSPASITFSVMLGNDPADQTLTISNSGGGLLDWTAVEEYVNWLTIDKTSGTGNGTVTLHVSSSTLAASEYHTFIDISATGATNSSVRVPVTLFVNEPTHSISGQIRGLPEEKLAGQEISLLNSLGQKIKSTRTYISGGFDLTGITSGTYEVVAPTIYLYTASPTTYQVSLGGNQIQSILTFTYSPMAAAAGKNPYCHPNPFDPGSGTVITFKVDSGSTAKLLIYNSAGECVWQKTNIGSGDQNIIWDGSNSFGRSVATGPYYFIVIANGKVIGRGEACAVRR